MRIFEHPNFNNEDGVAMGDEVVQAPVILGELELIAVRAGGVYWFMDYRYWDNRGGAFLTSKVYKSDKKAIEALAAGKIKWVGSNVWERRD